MKTTVNIVEDVPAVNVNLVPCKIQYTGPSNTKEFFTPSKQKEIWHNQDVVTATFRGMKLVGETIEFKDKVGFVCNGVEFSKENTNNSGGIETFKELNSIAKFEDITVYGHDACPSENNKWKMLSEWDAISAAINS